jgi:hypothetical protein
VLVEEDACVFLRTLASRAEDGYSEVLHDPGRRLKVFMGPGEKVRSALSNAVVGRDGTGGDWDAECDVEACASAVGDIDNYGEWDYSWARVEGCGHIDAHNAVCYMVSDAPPMPYSFVITQRDFATTRLCLRFPGCRSSAVVYRNAASGLAPQWPALIRGEVIGAIGFFMTPMSARRALSLPRGGVGVEGGGVAGALPRGLLVASGVEGREESIAPPPLPVGARGTEAALAVCARHAPGPMLSVMPPISWVGQTHVVTTAKADPKGTIPAFLINFVACVFGRETPFRYSPPSPVLFSFSVFRSLAEQITEQAAKRWFSHTPTRAHARTHAPHTHTNTHTGTLTQTLPTLQKEDARKVAGQAR